MKSALMLMALVFFVAAPAHAASKNALCSGRGTSVQVVYVEAGKYQATVWHDGQSNCIVVAHFLAGNILDSVHMANFIGSKSETVFADFRETGKYAVEVKADGGWEIRMHRLDTPSNVSPMFHPSKPMHAEPTIPIETYFPNRERANKKKSSE